MNWEEGYDCGYYEGLRNAVRCLIQSMGIGAEVHEIIAVLREWRDNAHHQYMENKGDEE